jgi:hypothetical protein
VATSILTVPTVSTAYLVHELRAARGWQHRAIAEIAETAVDDVARWDADHLDHLAPHQRRQVETILSTASTQPWWHREHD